MAYRVVECYRNSLPTWQLATQASGHCRSAMALAVGPEAAAIALEFWRAFDLDSKRPVLDQQALTMQSAKEESIRSRKLLAEGTKEFRKLPEASKGSRCGPLLKSYQDEIDRLTKRAKFADAAFFALYKSMYEAPDPAPALASAASTAGGSSASALTTENERLRREIAEYEDEFKTLKNQDVAVRALEDQVEEWEDKLQLRVEEAVAAKEAELSQRAQEQETALRQRETEMEERVAEARASVAEVQAQADGLKAQLFARRQADEERRAATSSEHELMAAEHDEAEGLRRENEELRRKLTVASKEAAAAMRAAQSPSDDACSASADANDALSKALRDAQRALADAKRQRDEASRTLLTRASEHEAATAELRTRVEELQTELKTRADPHEVERLRSELRVLKALEYNVVDDATGRRTKGEAGGRPGDLQSGNSGADGADDDLAGVGGMEKLLLARVRRAEAETSQQRRKLEETQQQMQDAHDARKRLERTNEDQRKLIAKLEDDVTKAAASPAKMPRAGAAAGETSSQQSSEQDGAHMLSQLLDVNPDECEGQSKAPESADAGMLGIVQAQRDRFRQRLHEAEVEKGKLSSQNNSLAQKLQTLQHDNLQLYEKIRFLENYTDGSSTSLPKRSSNQNQHEDLEAGAASGAEAKYSKMYDDKINPFNEFHRKQRQQKYAKLSTIDRIALNSSMLLTSNKFARLIAFVYILCLHALVFFTLLYFSHVTHHPHKRLHAVHRAAHLAARAAAAAAQGSGHA